jgi:hypothetical protein
MHGPALTAAEVREGERRKSAADYAAFITSTTNHTPSPEAIADIETFRAEVQDVAARLILNVPSSRARAVALTHLEDAVMWGVKAIILEDRQP